MMTTNPLFQAVGRWFRRNFSDPAAIGLFFTLIIGFLLLEFFGRILFPILLSIILAYLLSSVVRVMVRWRCPNAFAVSIVFVLFVGLLVYALLVLLPLLWHQLSNLIDEIPGMVTHTKTWLHNLSLKYPKLFSEQQVQSVIAFLSAESGKVGPVLFRYSLATIPSLIQVVLYVVLVPLLVFFFLKDRQEVVQWCSQFLPSHRTLVNRVWGEVNYKIGVYVRSRVLEIIIVGVTSTIAFSMLSLQYAPLLGVLVGLSVIIPYIGAIVVTIPIVIVALLQFGLGVHFWYVVAAYALIITLDGNLLVPLLFAGTMDLHPIVIIIAVVIFGGIWGFWGVFFAIPLATLVHAVLKAWPRTPINGEERTEKAGS